MAPSSARRGRHADLVKRRSGPDHQLGAEGFGLLFDSGQSTGGKPDHDLHVAGDQSMHPVRLTVGPRMPVGGGRQDFVLKHDMSGIFMAATQRRTGNAERSAQASRIRPSRIPYTSSSLRARARTDAERRCSDPSTALFCSNCWSSDGLLRRGRAAANAHRYRTTKPSPLSGAAEV